MNDFLTLVCIFPPTAILEIRGGGGGGGIFCLLTDGVTKPFSILCTGALQFTVDF
jgi:hypothetical protein